MTDASRSRRRVRRVRALHRAHQVDVATIARIALIDDDRLRNHEITFEYWKLGRDLSGALDSEHTNWCTWATWASRTVGHALDPHERPILVEQRTQGWPRWLRGLAFALVRWSRSVLNPRMAPAIAEGNREIFREIADHFRRFLDAHRAGSLPDRTAARAWVAALRPAEAIDVATEELFSHYQRGFLAYYDATCATDLRERADHILLGNLLMAEYEQMRLQPWIEEAFFVSSKNAGAVRRVFQRMFGPTIARITTKHVTAIVTPKILIPVAEPLRMLPGRIPYAPGGSNADLDLCIRELRGAAPLPCESWPDYPARMASIAALFVSYHDEQTLDLPPFSEEAQAALEAALARLLSG